MCQDFYNKNFEKTILISSDGDYSSLAQFLKSEGVLLGIISPSTEKKCSVLLKRTDAKIYYISDQKSILTKEKAPDKDRTL